MTLFELAKRQTSFEDWWLNDYDQVNQWLTQLRRLKDHYEHYDSKVANHCPLCPTAVRIRNTQRNHSPSLDIQVHCTTCVWMLFTGTDCTDYFYTWRNDRNWHKVFIADLDGFRDWRKDPPMFFANSKNLEKLGIARRAQGHWRTHRIKMLDDWISELRKHLETLEGKDVK